MQFHFLTLFPEVFLPILDSSLLGRAQKKGLVSYHFTQIRDFAKDKHKKVDSAPFGGGAGMLMKPDVLYDAWRSIYGSETLSNQSSSHEEKEGQAVTVLLSPQGCLFTQKTAKKFLSFSKIILVCGHYEGVDERFIDECVDYEVSIGNYILTGGELAALVVADTITRLIPGVVGNTESLKEESLEKNLLKYPQYTGPREFHGRSVPPVLLSGNHQDIDFWREKERKTRTEKKRPDLLESSLHRFRPVFIVLLHTQVLNRNGMDVTTSVTNLDIHDISRSARTYGIENYFLVTPIEDQHTLVKRILSHWSTKESQEYHPDRVEALSLVRMAYSFDEVKTVVRDRFQEDPEVVLTDAKPHVDSVSYETYRQEFQDPSKLGKPVVLVFGTGWGVASVFYPEVHRILDPVYGSEGSVGYNHLSVRSAVAVILDRLFGK